ncbi:MAG TPA: metal ABC transporter substrate-binding protein [Anaerolineae bacterium]|nr:metal ABC transporter substrate-binding protein [Anaerolineae bacterium]
MKKRAHTAFTILSMLAVLAFAASCQSRTMPTQEGAKAPRLNVLAVETFLADIAQNVVGDRSGVEALMPLGVDPHGFEPTPSDVTKVTNADVLITNGAGLETPLDRLLENVGGEHEVIEASAGLTGRIGHEGEVDPHFWLDPNNVVQYVENIREGLIGADPEGSATYTANAAAYTARLEELDSWIAAQVERIPAERRLLVTNHESLGYFAERYGFTIVGTILPSVSTGSSPSAQQIAALVEQIRGHDVAAIFLETGANSQLAQQIAQETGVRVVTQLYTHSTTDPEGPAPTYIEMMKYNTSIIVEALG